MTSGVRAFESADLAVDARAGLGEGPVWDPVTSRLIWLDLVDWWNNADSATGVVHLHDPSGGGDGSIDVPGGLGSVALRSNGTLIVAAGDGFGALDLQSGEFDLSLPMGLEDGGMRFNDGGCDPQGRFWAGSTERANEFNWLGVLHRIDADWHVEEMLTGVGGANGVGWSPDGETMYYVDTPTRKIDSFRFDGDTGSIADRQTHAEIPDGYGVPDGLAVDAEGGVWVAVWGSSRVLRYVPDGSLDAEVVLPVSQPTSCVFGGDDLETLYITTAWAALSDEQMAAEPHAGGVFAVDVGVPGRPKAGYAG